MLQYNYWEQLTYEIDENFPELISHSPYPQNYYNLSLEKHLAHVSLVINTVKKRLTTQLWIDDDKELFDFLYEYKNDIEDEIGFELTWERLDNKKASRIDIYKNFDVKKNKNWDEAIKWHLKMACKFQNAFNDKLKQYE